MSDIMLPLADVRIIAVEQFGAGPWATLQFADLGAEVIKIEHPGVGGDVGRYVPPYQEGEDSLFFETFNRNKQSVSLDIGHPEGRRAFEDLVRGADAVFSNLRGDQPAKLRLTYDDLKDVNPRVVCCSLSGFGMTGPRAKEGGYDYTLQGYAGWMTLTGPPGAPPMRSGISAVDLSGGYVAAFALLAGLWSARRDGRGCDCDISLLEAALAGLWYLGTWAATAGHVPRRTEDSAHPSIVPFQNFATQDGWVMVGCAKEKFWVALCREVVDRPDLLEDPRYADFGARERHREPLIAELKRLFAARPMAHWLERLRAAGIPHSPNNTVPEALEDPQIAAREGLVAYEHPVFGTVRQVATAMRVGSEPKPAGRAPARGEHTARVLADLCGYGPERLDELVRSGALGDAPPAAAAGA
jgi:crotonobetainyl-CoA:carnitine CoA-transferase CaiB-like acyl-CoA transferase